MRHPRYAMPQAGARNKIPYALAAVHAGTMTFDRFVIETSTEWERLGAYVHKMWPLPAGVGLEDIVQEMLLAAWAATQRWDPNRGIPLHTHVVWSAVARGKRFCHEQRNAPRRVAGTDGRYALIARREEDGLIGASTAAVRAWYEEPDDEVVDLSLLRARACHDGRMGVVTLLDAGCDRKEAVRVLCAAGNTECTARRVIAEAVRELTES